MNFGSSLFFPKFVSSEAWDSWQGDSIKRKKIHKKFLFALHYIPYGAYELYSQLQSKLTIKITSSIKDDTKILKSIELTYKDCKWDFGLYKPSMPSN